MAYVVQNSEVSFGTNSNISSFTPTLPEGIAVDDYVVYYLCLNQNRTITATGWNKVQDVFGGASRSSWIYKKVTALPFTAPSITLSSSAGIGYTGSIVRDADLTTFIDASGSNTYGSNGTSKTIPSITPTNNDSLLLFATTNRITGDLIEFPEASYGLGYSNIGPAFVVAAGYQATAAATSAIVTNTTNNVGTTSILAIKNKAGGQKGINVSGGPAYFMQGGNGQLSSPVSLSTRRTTINAITVSPTTGLSIDTANNVGMNSDGADFSSGMGVGCKITAASSSNVGNFHGVIFSVSATDFSSDKLMFSYDLGSLDHNFINDFSLYLEDSAGNWAVRKLRDHDDWGGTSVEIFTHYGEFATNTDSYPITDSSGTLDYSDIVYWGTCWISVIDNTGGRYHTLQNFGNFENPTVFVGGGPDNSINPRIISKSLPFFSKRHAVARQGENQDLIRESVQIGDGTIATYYKAPFTSLEIGKREEVAGSSPYICANLDRSIDIEFNASASCTFDLGSSSIYSPDLQNITFLGSSSATVIMQGATIAGLYGTLLTGQTFDGGSFLECDEIQAAGAIVDNYKISDTLAGATEAAIAFDTNSTMTGTEIDVTGTSAGYHIELGTAVTAFTLTDVTFTGTPGTDKIHVLKTSGTVTISTSGTTLVAADVTSAGATVVISAAPVDIDLTGLIAGSEVRIYEAGTTTEIDGVESSGTSFSTTTIESSIDIVVFHKSYEPVRILAVDSTSAVNLPIQQVFDRNYSNP